MIKTTNKLITEKSPYLLQHAYNPVLWYPWGEEAFRIAKEEDKPIFLSIGYSTCHWCHVMAHESFEDPEIAELLNESFVNIKVDKEERPDLNDIYMKVCQILTGHGGWPLTIMMHPDKKPFFAATYIPKNGRFGRIGLTELIPRVNKLWNEQRIQLKNTSEEVSKALYANSKSSHAVSIDKEVFTAAFSQLAASFDEHYGGFGRAPKFPSPHTLLFLLRYWQRSGEKRAMDMVTKTLYMMRRGGIFDHIGFGFHRYSTDISWFIPHFEKMLYDQAMLILVCAETYQATKENIYKDISDEIFAYLLCDMTSPFGVFFSAEDADSEGEEGKSYVWTAQEIRDVLNEKDAEFAIRIFNVESSGNYEEEATLKKNGSNILYLKKSEQDLAAELGMTLQDFQRKKEAVRKQLFTARQARQHPHKDDKILTDWNGLMIAALARAGQTFANEQYIAAAEKAMEFLLATMLDKKGKLYHRYREGDVAIEAFLDDYSFVIWGLLELYEATFDVSYLARAIKLCDAMVNNFWDEENYGFFFTSNTTEKILLRPKNIYDGAIPSGNSVALSLLLRLGRLTGDQSYEQKATLMVEHNLEKIKRNPTAYTHFLSAVDFLLSDPLEVVIAAKSDSKDLPLLLEELRSFYVPNKTVLFRPTNNDSPDILQYAPYTQSMKSVDGKATIYICSNYSCTEPVNSNKKLHERLEKVSKKNN